MAVEMGHVSGTVASAATGEPLSGVKVCAANVNGDGPWGCDVTGAGGRYESSVYETGSYYVSFDAPSGSSYIARTYYGGKYSERESQAVSITIGQTTSDIDAALLEGGRIAGRVTSASTKQPVEAVEVCARETPASCAMTDANGEYEVSGLASGQYEVQFGFSYGGSLGQRYVAPEFYDNRHFISSISQADAVSVTAGGSVEGINDELEEFSSLGGRVTSASSGKPIAGVEVRAAGSADGMAAGGRAVTDANGEYTVTGMADPRSEYHVEFGLQLGYELDFFPQWYDDEESSAQADAVKVPLGGSVSGIDAALTEGGQIAGTVTDAHTRAPLAGISACARNKVVYEARCATTTANGSYTIPRLPAGSYTVEFYANSEDHFTQYYNGRQGESEAEQVPVELGGTTSGIDAALEPVVDGAILGRVSEAVWAKPLANIEVCAYRLGEAEEGLFGQCARSNDEGEYALRELAAGEYLVEYSSVGSGLEYATQFFKDRVSPLYAEPVSVSAGKYTAGIDGNLTKAGDASGRVVSAATGKPIGGIEVCYFAFSQELVGCLLTDAKGEYSTPPLAQDEYQVLFASPPESGLNYAAQFYGNVNSINNATRISVQAGKTTTGIGADMHAGARITGAVTTALGGGALGGALVCAQPGYYEVGGCAITGGGGKYAIEGLSGGSYRVLFEAEGFSSQYYDDATEQSRAQKVEVLAGASASGIDAAMKSLAGQAPSDLSRPSILGIGRVGERLECSPGSWLGNPRPSFSFGWLRDGHTNVGVGSSYIVREADQGSTLECEVTAENSSGSATAFSEPLRIAPASERLEPPLPVPAELGGVRTGAVSAAPSAWPSPETGQSVLGAKSESLPVGAGSAGVSAKIQADRAAVVRGGRLELRLRCEGGPCRGTVSVTIRRASSGARRAVVLASGQMRLATGRAWHTCSLRLSKASLARLAHVTHRHIVARLSIALRGGATVSRPVVIF
jgi:Carboxypeptidase regulatory-like domain